MLKASHWFAGQAPTPAHEAATSAMLWRVLAEHLSAGAAPCEQSVVKQNAAGHTLSCFDAILDGPQGRYVLINAGPVDASQITDQANQWLSWAIPAASHLGIQYAVIISGSMINPVQTRVDLPEDVLSDLPAAGIAPPKQRTLEAMADEYAAWRLLIQEATAASDALETKIIQAAKDVPMDASGVLQVGPTKVRLNKVYDPDRVDQAIRGILAQRGHTPNDIETIYGLHPNFWTKATMDADALIDLVQRHLAIDVRTDPRFIDAIAKPAKPNMSTRMEFLDDLDAEQAIDRATLLDAEQSGLRAELSKDSPTGAIRALRDATRAALKTQVEPIVAASGSGFSAARAHIQSVSPPPKSRRRT